MTLAKCATLVYTCCMRSQPKGWHVPNRLTHAPSFIIAFSTVHDGYTSARLLRPAGSRTTPPHGCKSIGSYSHLVTISKIALLVRLLWSMTLLHRQAPKYMLSHGAAMVLVRCTLFAHHSDSPTLTLWRREFSPNERDAESMNLPQPNVELFLLRVDEPSQWRQLHQT